MFIVHFTDGSTYTENDGPWDSVPDKGITGLEVTLPMELRKLDSKGQVVNRHTPTIKLPGSFDRYYCATMARATLMTIQGNMGQAVKPVPEIIGTALAGVDDQNDLVIYIEVSKSADVDIKRFPRSQIFWDQSTMKKGARSLQ